jgi:hypothetical protein
MVKMGLVVGAMAVLTGCQDPMSALIKTTIQTASEIGSPPVLTDPKNKLSNIDFTNINHVNVGSAVNLRIVDNNKNGSMDIEKTHKLILEGLQKKGIKLSQDGTEVVVNLISYGDMGYALTSGSSATQGAGALASSMGASLLTSIAVESVDVISRSRTQENIVYGNKFTISVPSKNFLTEGKITSSTGVDDPHVSTIYTAYSVVEFLDI